MFFCSLSLNVCNIGLQCNLRFLSTKVLQGSVATRVNYGKIFNDLFIANLLLSVMVKECWRSVRIRQSYGKKIKWHLFFPDTVYIVLYCIVLYTLYLSKTNYNKDCSKWLLSIYLKDRSDCISLSSVGKLICRLICYFFYFTVLFLI